MSVCLSVCLSMCVKVSNFTCDMGIPSNCNHHRNELFRNRNLNQMNLNFFNLRKKIFFFLNNNFSVVWDYKLSIMWIIDGDGGWVGRSIRGVVETGNVAVLRNYLHIVVVRSHLHTSSSDWEAELHNLHKFIVTQVHH